MLDNHHKKSINPPMAKGGGDATSHNRFFHFFSGMGGAFLQTKFLAIGSSLVHLSIKSFSNLTYRLLKKNS